MSLLEAKGLAKAYKKRRVVNGVTFSVSPGEIAVAIMAEIINEMRGD